jgi:Uma2 family endonuclease
MNIQSHPRMSKDAFIAWTEGVEERCELVGGHVVMMAHASRTHNRLVRNLTILLHRLLDQRVWEVFAEFGLETEPDTLRYPDIAVDRAGGGGKDYVSNAPILLAEILSPSTTAVDLGDKVAEYLKLPSLKAYLVFAQDEPKAWAWLRDDGPFSPLPARYTGTESVIPVTALQIELPLIEIYRGIDGIV